MPVYCKPGGDEPAKGCWLCLQLFEVLFLFFFSAFVYIRTQHVVCTAVVWYTAGVLTVREATKVEAASEPGNVGGEAGAKTRASGVTVRPNDARCLAV